MQLLRGVFRWLFFCDTGSRWIARRVAGHSPDDPCDRRRLLCWVVLCAFVWAHVPHTLLNVVLLLACVASLSLTVNLITNTRSDVGELTGSVCNLILVVGLVSAMAVVSCLPCYLRYEYLVKKMALKEYDVWRRRCSSTYVTLVGIIMVCCVVRGLHKRLGLHY